MKISFMPAGSIFIRKKMAILIHCAIWIVLFFFPSFLQYRNSISDNHFLKLNYVQTTIYFVIFYVNYLWLIPDFFFKRKKIWYFLIAIAMIFAAAGLMEVSHSKIFPEPRMNQPFRVERLGPGDNPVLKPMKRPFMKPLGKPDEKPFKGWPIYNFILTTSLVTGLSLGLRFSDKLVQNEKKRKEVEKEKLNSELAMLKNQINPHFLFNTLNSIYSLALMKSDFTAEAVMKLSDMMRYVIQDVQFEKVPLSRELDYIRYYVELQKLRTSENVHLQLSIDGDPAPYQIAPMIMIPFVENAFKYGTTAHHKANIIVNILIGNRFLEFKVSNQIFEGREYNETFGIGIKNTRQRLNMIYPEKHNLTIINNGKVYVVDLRVELV